MATQGPNEERVPPHFRKQMKVKVQGKSFVISAGKDCYFESLIFSKNKKVAIALRLRDTGKWFSPDSIVRLGRKGIDDPLSLCTIPDAGKISDIYGVSDDGQRLLVQLHYVTKKTKKSTSYGSRPVILDTIGQAIHDIDF